MEWARWGGALGVTETGGRGLDWANVIARKNQIVLYRDGIRIRWGPRRHQRHGPSVGPHVLPAVDDEVCAALMALASDAGLDIREGVRVARIGPDGTVEAQIAGRPERCPADVVLVATGRPANIPALAQVGLTEADVREQGFRVAVTRAPFEDSSAAGIRNETEGLVKVVYDEPSGRLRGVHVLEAGAEDLIHHHGCGYAWRPEPPPERGGHALRFSDPGRQCR